MRHSDELGAGRTGQLNIRRLVAATRLARVAALPMRSAAVARHNGRELKRSISWLVTSREHTNYTYDLTVRNEAHLAWFVANIAKVEVSKARQYIAELKSDAEIAGHVRSVAVATNRRWLMDSSFRPARRLGWYALIRAMRPAHVIETGTDKGLGSVTISAALLRNEEGRLTTIDVNPGSGSLIGGRFASVVDRRIGSSLDLLPGTHPADLFIHDSCHEPDFERAELDTVRLNEGAVLLSDNSHGSPALEEWAEQTGRRFHFFAEQPADHWYPGGGIGVAI